MRQSLLLHQLRVDPIPLLLDEAFEARGVTPLRREQDQFTVTINRDLECSPSGTPTNGKGKVVYDEEGGHRVSFALFAFASSTKRSAVRDKRSNGTTS